MIKTRDITSIAATASLLLLTTASFANDSTLKFTLTNFTKHTIEITGYQNSVRPGPIYPINPIKMPPVSPEQVTIPAGHKQLFTFNCPLHGHVSGNLTFTDLNTKKTGVITLFDPWEAFAGSSNFTAHGDTTSLMLIGKTQPAKKSHNDLRIATANTYLVR